MNREAIRSLRRGQAVLVHTQCFKHLFNALRMPWRSGGGRNGIGSVGHALRSGYQSIFYFVAVHRAGSPDNGTHPRRTINRSTPTTVGLSL